MEVGYIEGSRVSIYYVCVWFVGVGGGAGGGGGGAAAGIGHLTSLPPPSLPIKNPPLMVCNQQGSK